MRRESVNNQKGLVETNARMTQSSVISHLMRFWGPIVPVTNEVYNFMRAVARLRSTLLCPSRIELSPRSDIAFSFRSQ